MAKNNYVSLFRRNEHKFISNKMQKQQKIVVWKQTSLQYRLLKQIQTWKIKGECFIIRPTSSFHEREFEQNYNQKGFL